MLQSSNGSSILTAKMAKHYVDASPGYWKEYTNLQHVKHELIRRYLGGWFPKLGTWAGRVLYFDTHAGRGKHLTGQLGSPLVALDTLLNHRHLARLLKQSEFRFTFIERDEGNYESLKAELATRNVPAKVFVKPVPGDCFGHLKTLLSNLQENYAKMAPAFVFVDPYGFKVPGALLRDLMAAGRVELFVNVIWREFDMAIGRARNGHAGFSKTLDVIFNGPAWRDRISSDDFDGRADQAVNLLAEIIGATWATHIKMLGDTGLTRYLLLHLTNHDAGRDLMKDCVWAVCPDGGFYVRKSADPRQQLLIQPNPDLTPLEEWVISKLEGGPRRWSSLEEMVRPEIWKPKHLNQVVRTLYEDGKLAPEKAVPKFIRRADPVLTLTKSGASGSSREN